VFEIVVSTNVSTTFAGTGTAGFSGEYGPATAAQINNPDDVFAKNGNVYITDTSSSCVRVVE
jgi:hypothetical protein